MRLYKNTLYGYKGMVDKVNSTSPHNKKCDGVHKIAKCTE